MPAGVARAVPGGRRARARRLRPPRRRQEAEHDPPVPGARVGDYVVDESDQAAMFTNHGAAAAGPLRARGAPELHVHAKRRAPPTLDVGPARGVRRASPTTPRTGPTPRSEPLNSPPCAQLDVDPDHVPYVALAGSPRRCRGSPPRESDDAIPVDERRVTIDRGHGAFVVSATGTTDRERRRPTSSTRAARPTRSLGGPITLDKLGYDDGPTRRWSPTPGWSSSTTGVALSTSAALCPPATQPGEPRTPENCQDPPS